MSSMFNKSALQIATPKYGKYMASVLNANIDLVREVDIAQRRDESIFVQWDGEDPRNISIDKIGGDFGQSWLMVLRSRDDVSSGFPMSSFWIPDITREPTGNYCVYEFDIIDEDKDGAVRISMSSPKDIQSYGRPFDADTGKSYIGVTKRGIDTRMKEHIRSVRDPKYLFHRVLRNASMRKLLVRALRVGIDYDTAMDAEEKMVASATLYPRGLNSIPGGHAGIAYLASKGFKTNAKEMNSARDKVVNRFLESRRDNPLFALRLQTDDELITRIICGNPNNFSETEVRKIRAMDEIGWGYEDIATSLGTNVRRVGNLLGGRTYSRVA